MRHPSYPKRQIADIGMKFLAGKQRDTITMGGQRSGAVNVYFVPKWESALEVGREVLNLGWDRGFNNFGRG